MQPIIADRCYLSTTRLNPFTAKFISILGPYVKKEAEGWEADSEKREVDFCSGYIIGLYSYQLR